MLEIRNLQKTYEGFRIENLNLEIAEGELLTLLGESGSGKSTVLRIAAALDEDYIGDVRLKGKPIKSALTSGEIAVVFQDPLLLNHLTLWENIRFSIRFKKLGKGEEDKRVSEAIELLELSGLEKRYPHELSGGQKQRVAIARALVMKPQFLLMDEPFSALDAPLRIRLQHKIREIQKKKQLMVLFITHDRDEAFAISDRIGVMQRGAVIQIDTPKALYEHPNSAFIAQFLGMENIFSPEKISQIFTQAISNEFGKFENLIMRSEDLRIKSSHQKGDSQGDFKDRETVSEDGSGETFQMNGEISREKLNFRGKILDHTFKSGFYEFTLELSSGDRLKVKQHRTDFEIVQGREMEISIRKEDIIIIR